MASPLTKFAEDIFVSRPAPAISNNALNLPDTKQAQPDLVVLTGWMDGSIRHLSKYSDAYRLLFPAATVVVIRSRQSSFYRLQSSQRQALAPIKRVFAEIKNNPATLNSTSPLEKPRVLVHCFSNGGVMTLKTVDDVLRTSNSRGIDPRAVIFDSCPGETSLPIMVRAFTAPIKSRILKGLASILIAFAYTTGGIVNFLLRKPNVILSLSRYLNKSFSRSPRLYFYSKEDLLIPHHCVEEHAVAASELGVDVTLEEFKGTAHVSHIRTEENAKRYWGAVEALWKKAVTQKPE